MVRDGWLLAQKRIHCLDYGCVKSLIFAKLIFVLFSIYNMENKMYISPFYLCFAFVACNFVTQFSVFFSANIFS